MANPDDSFQFNNSVKKVKGSHSLSFGFNLLHWRHYVGVQGTSNLQYSPLTTGLPGFTTTGESAASFFLGLPTSTSYGFGNPKKTYGNIYVGFAGDTWKISQKLTLTLRPAIRLRHAAGRKSGFRDGCGTGTHPAPCDRLHLRLCLGRDKSDYGAAAANSSRGLLQPDKNNFAPRLGLAYSPFKNTSIRAGFGLFYDYNTNLIQNNNARGFAYPFAVSRSISGQNLTTINPNINLDTPYVPFTPSVAQFGSPLDPYRRDPYALTWNFGIEHMLRRQPAAGRRLRRLGRPQAVHQRPAQSGARRHPAISTPAVPGRTPAPIHSSSSTSAIRITTRCRRSSSAASRVA